jgi:polysaccharide biosynthesis/export protein
MILAALAAVMWSSPAASQAPEGAQFLRSGDMIKLDIWREPDMSGDYLINESGSVIFPRVGEYAVLGETPATLEAKLQADYQQYLRNPSINVTVFRRVSIIGAVNDPGLKQVDPTFTIMDALALAGGATNLGDQNKIRIIRDGVQIEAELSVDTRLADSIIRSGDQIFVPERAWLSRNTGVIATGISATVALVIALFIR